MEYVTDWLKMWRELSQLQTHSWKQNATPAQEGDTWRTRARDFHVNARRRLSRIDSSQALIISHLDASPGSSVLDIGAGTGVWTIALSKHARTVTALDPSPAMIEVMHENLAEAGITNVQVVRGSWPDAQVEPHDLSLCSHAMYGIADLETFVRRMIQVTRRTCYLVMRAPTADGLLAEASTHILGHRYDSPNFQVAYNALLQMGLFPNVLMEDSGLWTPWSSDSLQAALDDMKRRFGLVGDTTHDAFLTELLQRRLTLVDGKYVWPRGVRSALIYWDVAG